MSNLIITKKLTTVKYDRRARQWQAINGRLLGHWPAGPEGHRAAHLAALRHDAPQVAAEVEAIITNAEAVAHLMYDAEAISRRAIRAGFLVRDGRVLPPVAFDQYGGCINEIARVQGSDELPYIISHDGDECHCDCPDYQLGNAPLLPSGQAACKHILAILINEALESNPLPLII